MSTDWKDLTPIQTEVLKALTKHKKGASRQFLQEVVYHGQSPNYDRVIRKAIENLRNRGFVILSSSDQRGYRLAATENEVRHYVAEQIKKAKTLMKTARKVKKAYGLRDQLSMGLTG
jgi:allophanate hydrolase subunit 2